MKLFRNVKLYYFSQLLSGLLFTIPIWVAFQHRYLSYVQMSWVQSLLLIVSILLQLPTGALADVIGRRRAMMLGWLIAGFSNIFMGFSWDATSMIIGLLFVAIGTTFVSGADTALLYDSLKQLGRSEDFPKINARGIISYRLSMVISVFLGGYLYQANIGLPVILKGFAQLCIIGVAFWMLEPYIDSEKFTVQKYIGRLKTGMMNLIGTTHIKRLSIYYVLVGGITWSCLYYLINTFAKDIGFTEIGQGWILSFAYIISTSIMLFVTEHKTLLKKYKYIVFLIFPLVMIASLLPGIYASKFTGSFMLIGILLAGGSRFAILDGYINDEFGSEARATTLSTLNMLVQLLTAFIIFVNGPIQERFTTKPMFTILGITTIIFVLPLGLTLFRKTNPHNLPLPVSSN